MNCLSVKISGPQQALAHLAALTTSLAIKEQSIMANASVPAPLRTVKRFQEESVWASGKFTVDSDGRVWRGSSRAERRVPLGYLQVKVNVRGVSYCTGAHRLVWRALVGPIPSGMVINHKNGKKDDNRLENLEAVSNSENIKHAFRTGLKDQHGESNPAAKLTDDDVEKIRKIYSAGGSTMKQIGEMFGVQFQHVSRIVRGKRRHKQCGPTASEDLRHSVCDRDETTGRFTSPQDLQVRQMPRTERP